jgi:lysylphosphatidylglycerol synthetase-like protein (DUF2156 family)
VEDLTEVTIIPDGLRQPLAVDVPMGGQALIVAELRLAPRATSTSTQICADLAEALGVWHGPGVIVVAGGLFAVAEEIGGAGAAEEADPTPALSAHPRLVEALVRFTREPGRRVVVIPGSSDSWLAWSTEAGEVLTRRLGAEVALAVDLRVHTASGLRRVRVESGTRFDPLARRVDPVNPRETPFSYHLLTEVLPAMQAQDGAGGGRRPWLAGLQQLDDPAAFPRFLASRLAYRKLGRRSWLLAVPVILALLLRLPLTFLRTAKGYLSGPGRVGLSISVALVELALLIILAAFSFRSAWSALAGVTLGQAERDPNEEARAAARDLVTAGFTGLVTAHTCRPEVAALGNGFYANPGCGTDVVSEEAARLPGLGLPSPFLAYRQVGWLELEAGSDLQVRLRHTRQALPGASLLERALTVPGPLRATPPGRRSASRVSAAPSAGARSLLRWPRARRPGAWRASAGPAGRPGAPELVASWPATDSWPPMPSLQLSRRRVRRVGAVVVALAGLLSLISALSDQLADHLAFVRNVLPLAVPETAASLAALAGIGLLMAARSVLRGQRRAYRVCLSILLLVTALHLIHNIDLLQAVVAAVVAGYLWLNRQAFQAGSDAASLPRGLLTWAGAIGVVLVCGTLALETSSWWTVSRRHLPGRISFGHALEATAARLIGLHAVALPRRLEEFFYPAMLTVGIGLGVVLAAMVFRPVVMHRPRAHADAALPRARQIVRAYGSGTLDYFALRSDKQFFFWGDTLVAFAVHSGVCVVSPDPIGPRSERESAWAAFRSYVDDHGWVLAGLGAGEEWLPIYRASGMHDLYVGDEAVVRVDRFTLEGGKFKGLRQAVNRVAKYGYTISFHDPAHLDPHLADQLRQVMTKSRRGDVERGFSMTLGRVFEPEDADMLLAVVHGPGDDGPPVAFCQYVPAPGIDGYSLDLMRRDAGEHPNGITDFAVVETIKYLKAQGKHGLGLNFATMRAVLAGEGHGGVKQRVQAWMLRRMGGSMQIESLWKFNAKFEPDWQPRYAIYDSPEHAVTSALAIAKAESFWELPLIGRFLVPTTETPGTPAPSPGPDAGRPEGDSAPAPTAPVAQRAPGERV